jgi:superfamily II DNA or RNA helicase
MIPQPTKSLALHSQQVGRALRPTPGKAKVLILDHSGNTYRFGPADAPRAWSLEGRANEKCTSPAVCRCKACGALNPIAALTCEACGATLREPVPRPARIEVRTSALVEVERLRAMSYPQALRWAGTDAAQLRLVARARGYKAGWIWHCLQEIRGVA